MLLRSLNLRRLSYVILSGEKNQFLTQLPTIQEKLVDTLRNVTAPIVQSEVYLCVRVLLCRLSPHNLSSFWPVILTELVSACRMYAQSDAVLTQRHSTAFSTKSWFRYRRTVPKNSVSSSRRPNCLIFSSCCRRRNSKCKRLNYNTGLGLLTSL